MEKNSIIKGKSCGTIKVGDVNIEILAQALNKWTVNFMKDSPLTRNEFLARLSLSSKEEDILNHLIDKGVHLLICMPLELREELAF